MEIDGSYRKEIYKKEKAPTLRAPDVSGRLWRALCVCSALCALHKIFLLTYASLKFLSMNLRHKLGLICALKSGGMRYRKTFIELSYFPFASNS